MMAVSVIVMTADLVAARQLADSCEELMRGNACCVRGANRSRRRNVALPLGTALDVRHCKTACERAELRGAEGRELLW